MPTIIITDDADNVYANCTGFAPDEELYVEMRSKPAEGNPSTTGITAGVHRTTDDNGAARFRAPKSFLLEDLPRDVTATATVGDFATAHASFS